MKNGFEQVGEEEQELAEQQEQLHQREPDDATGAREPHPSHVTKQRQRRFRVLMVVTILAIVATLALVISIVLINRKSSNKASKASSSSSSQNHNANTPTFSPTFIPSHHPTKLKAAPKKTSKPSPFPTHAPTHPNSQLRKTLPPTTLFVHNVTSPVSSVTNVTATARPSTSFPSWNPSSAPTKSSSPSAFPSARPTFRHFTVAPSMSPSVSGLPPEQGQPTLSPTTTTSPTITPRAVDLTLYNYVLQLLVTNGVDSVALQQTTTREYQTFQFLIRSSQLLPSTFVFTDSWWLQRYALTSLYASLSNVTSELFTNSSSSRRHHLAEDYEDHCAWRGITCDNRTVTQIVWPRRSLSGNLPWLEWTMLAPSLIQLDLSENHLHGTLPTSLYQLSMLHALFLNSNNISGPLHNESIIQDVTWLNLTRLYLNDNQLTGPIPNGFQYNKLVRPLRYVLLQNNQLTGTFPANLNWKKLFYLDLGNNRLQGTLPDDAGRTFFALRNLFLDNNQFQGTIPQSWGSMGGGRLESFVVSNNRFSGSVPTGWGNGNKLLNLEVNNNNLTKPLDQSICDMIIMYHQNGNVIELDADCNICSCKYLCNMCTNSSR